MADYVQQYRDKLITVEQALELVQSNSVISTTVNALEPYEFLSRLHTVANRVSNVRLLHVGVFNPYEFITSDAYKGKIIPRTQFSDPFTISTHDAGVSEFVPAHAHNASTRDALREHVDLFVGVATPPDRHGYVRFSLGGLVNPSAQARLAKKVIIEVNPHVPVVEGYTELHISDIDYFYESEHDIVKIPQSEPDEVDEAVGRNVASLIEDGSTIQLGIGKIPDAAARFFRDKNDLGVHTELITSSIADLTERGVINGRAKTLLPGKIVGAFALGNQKLYDFLDHNPSVWVLPVSYVNNPQVIARNDRMVSVNAALQIDLTGQIDSESFGSKQYSGSGGAADFAIGATHSKGGKSIIAVRSTAKHGTISRIAAVLDPGSVVTISRNDIDYVVTEYGIAKLRGSTIAERVEALISIAHPRFRDQLREQAKEYKLW